MKIVNRAMNTPGGQTLPMKLSLASFSRKSDITRRLSGDGPNAYRKDGDGQIFSSAPWTLMSD